MPEMPSMPTFISYDVLPDARNWRIGQTYRIKLVLKQIEMGERGATFEVIDATSLEKNDARRTYLSSDSGSYGGK